MEFNPPFSSWTAKKTNEWVLNKAGVKREQDGTPRESVNENDRDEKRKYVHGVVNLWIEDG